MAKSTRRKTARSFTKADDREPRTPSDAGASVTADDIAHRAYDLYLARGREPGHELEDWLQAEQELRHSALASVM